MPKPTYTAFIPIMLLLASTAVHAGEDDYKTPANMADEDRHMLLTGSSEYSDCLTDKLREYGARVGDARALTDVAMASCEERLAELDEQMQAGNFHPDFRQHYVRSVKNRAARETVREAMYIVSQHESAGEQESSE